VALLSTTFRGFWVLMLIATLICAMDAGRAQESGRWSGEKISSIKQLDVCLVAPDIACKLTGAAAQSKPKVISALLAVALCVQSLEAVLGIVRMPLLQESGPVALHLSGTMVLRV
jgi:hypothetical protein